MAKTVYGEARGCSPEEQALVVWCVLQRVDDGGFGESIKEVITAPGQFQGYDADNLMWEDIYNLCAEEMTKWAQGEEPPTHEAYAPETPYLYFNGKNGHNWFRRFYDE
jgi:hypothetical protein